MRKAMNNNKRKMLLIRSHSLYLDPFFFLPPPALWCPVLLDRLQTTNFFVLFFSWIFLICFPWFFKKLGVWEETDYFSCLFWCFLSVCISIRILLLPYLRLLFLFVACRWFRGLLFTSAALGCIELSVASFRPFDSKLFFHHVCKNTEREKANNRGQTNNDKLWYDIIFFVVVFIVSLCCALPFIDFQWFSLIWILFRCCFHRFSLLCIVFHCFSLIWIFFVVVHCLSLFLFVVHCLSLIFIGLNFFRCCSLSFIDFHWFEFFSLLLSLFFFVVHCLSLIFIDLNFFHCLSLFLLIWWMYWRNDDVHLYTAKHWKRNTKRRRDLHMRHENHEEGKERRGAVSINLNWA